MRRDDGHVQVLEAMIVTLILLGSVFTVTTLRQPSRLGERMQTTMESVATDALLVLAGLRSANGSALELGLSEALHCNLDPAPSASSCAHGRGDNLSLKLESYLPPGSATMLGLANGAATREVWRDAHPLGSATTATFAFVPNWNLTFMAMDLSCVEAGVDANVTLVPIRQGNLTAATSVAVRMDNGATATAERAPEWGVWNATLPAATRPASGVATAAVTGKGATFPGSVAHADCALEGLGPALREAREASVLRAGGPTPVGGTATFTADLSPLLAVPGLTLADAELVVYEPLPPRGTEPDTFAPQAVLPVEPGATPTVAWDVPSDSLYGAHPVVLRATLSLALPSTAVVEVEARLVTVLEVALAGGTVPHAAPYTAILQVWIPDWH